MSCKKSNQSAGERDENPFVNKLIHEKLEKGTDPRKFSYRELVRATSNFEEGEKLGEGGFGRVYRGFIKDYSYVAVKRISSRSKQGISSLAMLCWIQIFNVKLGDFGLARLADQGEKSQTTIIAGTRGYMALEYVTTGKASKESDVYSFGVVALEIVCERKLIDFNLESSQIELVKWVWELYGEGKVIQAADPKLNGEFDKKSMECLMIVGLWCAHSDYKFRPSVQQVIQALNLEVPLPILPSKMPVATYFAPPRLLSTLLSETIRSERDQTGPQEITKSSQSPHLLQQYL
ncbi:unnamed protein product [Prunus armeniaca]